MKWSTLQAEMQQHHPTLITGAPAGTFKSLVSQWCAELPAFKGLPPGAWLKRVKCKGTREWRICFRRNRDGAGQA